MKNKIVLGLGLSLLLPTAAPADDVQQVKIAVSKRTPVDVKSMLGLRTYASDSGYYFSVHLHEGMRVAYSASYGVGGEAAQARGVIVEKDGHFYFKQSANPSMNLLLPPGSNGNGGGVSLWDIGAYMDLVNRVAFSDPNKASKTANDVYEATPQAFVVDFEGGTAGESVKYKDALEVSFSRSVGNRSDSKLSVYYAKGIGPVALEFRENMLPAGTFKFYVGE
jgi:hypothetical protein